MTTLIWQNTLQIYSQTLNENTNASNQFGMNKQQMFRPFQSDHYLKKGGFKVFYIDKSNISSIGKFLPVKKQQKRFPPVPELREEDKNQQQETSSYDQFQIQEKKSQKMQEQIDVPKKSNSFQPRPSAIPSQIQQKIREIIKMNSTLRSQDNRDINTFRQRVQNVIKKMSSKENTVQMNEEQPQPDNFQGQEHHEIQPETEYKSHIQVEGIQIGKAIIRKNGKKAREKPIMVNTTKTESNGNGNYKQQRDCKSKEKSYKQPKKSAMEIYQQHVYGQLQPERITRNKIKQNSFGEANFLQLQIKPKFNKQAAEIYKIKEKLRSKKNISSEAGLKKKIKKAKKIQPVQQQFQLQLSKKHKAILNQMLVNNLPPRNPNIKHQHNSVDSDQIVLKTFLKDNKLYFASEMLNYNKNNKALNIKCGHRVSSFIQQTLKSSQSCKTIDEVPHDSLIKKIKLKRNFEYTNKKTLVLDLDQTLVHSQGLFERANKQIFPFSFQFDKTTRHYTIRNYAKEFIQNLSQKFYIVVFTSAVEGYADNILEHIDPEEKYIQHRLYRSNCYLHGEKYPYIKDLRILNRDLSQIIIVDNSLYAFWFNIDNGVPITSFTGTQDQELRKLQKYLLLLQNVDDVRKINRRAFHLHLYQEHQKSKQLLDAYCQLMKVEAESQDQSFKDI